MWGSSDPAIHAAADSALSPCYPSACRPLGPPSAGLRGGDLEGDGRLAPAGEAQFTNASLRAELANAKAVATHLRQQVHALKRQLGQVRGSAVEEASQFSVRSTWPAVAASLEPLPSGAAADHRTAEGNAGLLGEVMDLRQRLALREEELAAVRRLNADLTRRLNTP